MTEELSTTHRSPSLAVWVAAYLFSLALPFLCLRYAKAIGNMECLLGVLCGLLVHIGLIPILGATDGHPLQIFVLLLMGTSFYLVILWQYLAGRKAGLWSSNAMKQWRAAGIFFAAFLAIIFALAVTLFFLQGPAVDRGIP